MWAKADMICAVSFDRLQLPFLGKDDNGNRLYVQRHIEAEVLNQLLGCVLTGLGLARLTQHV